ncbi:ABC transporter ATP-binding protein [Candidatus Oscillochloris fontis]|uniref:ABC transporter ATP-binding protein n=1 Tax=Candidatus Oscillochloris fontis TaxID=2496868 RepID=UPI00101D23E2|nr:ABC transporter ATP-binding protein [Candidatus Oscillochloris fontis]
MADRNGASMPEAQMQIDGIGLSFGGVRALSGITFNIYPSTIQAIIGPNGAGKTSMLNCISGLYKPQQGQIRFEGRNLIGLAPHEIAQLGIARSFQNIELFRHMTVVDNLMLGRHVHMRGGVLTGGLYWGPGQREEIAHREAVEQVIDLLEIQSIRKKTVGSLSYGLQKRVELGRALAMNPRLLLLDEPMAGMNSEEKEDMARFILDISEEQRTTIVLIEHDMGVVMDISDNVAVLEFGQLIAYGTPAEVKANPAVVAAYLGQEHS